MKKWIIAGLMVIAYLSCLQAQTPHPPFSLPTPHVGSYKPNGQKDQIWPATIYLRDSKNVVTSIHGLVKVKKYAYYAIAGEWKVGEFGNVPPHWKVYGIMYDNGTTIPWSLFDHYETHPPDNIKKTMTR